jgi:glycogen debranching enzyme
VSEFPFDNVLIGSAENPDWGYARNNRMVLMSTSAEWTQSCSSCPLTIDGTEFITPNRDFPYEGLSVFLDGESWKFLDAFAIAVHLRDGRRLKLQPIEGDAAVELNPWTVVYHYRAADLPSSDPFANLSLTVSYRLHSTADPLADGISGETTVLISGISDLERSNIVLIVQPIVDIRHVFGTADFQQYQTTFSDEDPTRIALVNQGRRLTIQITRGRITRFDRPSILNWHYKLGSGEREETINVEGAAMTAFRSERKDVAAFFKVEREFGGEASLFTMYFHCSRAASDPYRPSLAELEQIAASSLENDRDRATELHHQFVPVIQERLADLGKPELQNAILGRIAGATRFKIAIENGGASPTLVPTAGAWWFKIPWFRDVFEGILNSFEVLMKLRDEKRNVGQVILSALQSQHPETGLIPNRFPWHKGEPALYNSSDATLLCLIAAGRYCRQTRDGAVASTMLSSFVRILKTLSRDVPATEDAPPRIHAETGLLLSTPQHSWIDTRALTMSYDGHDLRGLPSRVSPRFVMDLSDGPVSVREVAGCLATPRFFLPEINAQWILALRAILFDIAPYLGIGSSVGQQKDTAAALERSRRLLERAQSSFLKVFWNDVSGCLHNAVFEDAVTRDEIISEPTITAAALLGTEIFPQDLLERIWRVTQAWLLVHRNLVRYGKERLPFGISTRHVDARIYYNDAEYHADVIWPRSTPYLLRLLMLLNERDIARQIVINNLDHQMSEGAIFYNHELFSKPSGNNPWAVEATCDNPVPVKNAIQFWSQWCDPVIDLFSV